MPIEPRLALKLEQWLQTHSQTTPASEVNLRREFVRRFPLETIDKLTLEEYALGHEQAENSFCRWLEYRTNELGSIRGGGVRKHGVWFDRATKQWKWTRRYSSAEDALSRITSGLQELVDAVLEERLAELDQIGARALGATSYSHRMKPLYLYFPEKFMPISQPNHLRRFLAAVGGQEHGDVAELNSRLARVVQQTPEFSGMDFAQVTRFLYETVPLTDVEDEAEPNEGRRIWKIAPGGRASIWDMCRDHGCIAIGWLDDSDYRAFPNRNAIVSALEDAGESTGGASSIEHFARDVKIGDTVIANRGLREIVGVGVVTSEYIPPSDEHNPSTDNHLKHARRIDWRVERPVEMDFQFGQHTVIPLQSRQCAKIKQAYMNQYLNDEELRIILDELLPGELSEPADEQPMQVKRLLDCIRRTRNVLLYGPPGTGKTWTVRQFAREFLADQIRAPQSTEQVMLDVVRDLPWYAVMALAMSLDTSRARFSVPDLLQTDLIRAYSKIKQAKKVGASLHAYLQIHTGHESSTVRLAPGRRLEPHIFDKAPDKTWSLTDEGRQYVQDSLGDELGRLQAPAQQRREIDDYCSFVTFHQSFAYEEFVEGLKPITTAEGDVQYEVVDGAFRRICRMAESDPANKYVLVIDEINRANIAKVLGELITLLEDDKRIGRPNAIRVRLPYSGDLFGVPDNLFILGTMNTADRSIALLDIALRRRFVFVELMPDPTLLSANLLGVNLQRLLTVLNRRIEVLLDRDHQIGHSYLLGIDSIDDLRFAWINRILPLLQEYFYNDGERLRAVLGDALIQRASLDAVTLGASMEAFDLDDCRYELVRFEDDNASFLSALNSISDGNSAILEQ